ncbi:MAG: hypothetical protein MPJ50_00185 [Pirellulales bacterium]|nr:hypothetical protein [Pirellulales bacterium]
MNLSFTAQTPIIESFRVRQTRGLFDLPEERTAKVEFQAELPETSDDWQIGAIVGPSGSGKSTVARTAYGESIVARQEWPTDRAVIDALPKGPIKHVTGMLSSVGFSSPPGWLKPYHVLSTGEQFRCDLAAAVLSDQMLIVFDEFTSVVDRTAAQIGSAAVAHAVREANKRQKRTDFQKFVAVTCHYDVLPWLQPDWVLDMADGTLTRGRLRRPDIEITIHSARQSAWSAFARHHYLSGKLNPAAVCYLATWHGEPVAFCGVLNSIGHVGLRRISRLVVLPDYQGVGIGGRFMDAIGEIYADAGDRLRITTSHPAIIARLRTSSQWVVTSIRRGGSNWGAFAKRKKIHSTSFGRTVVSAEYVAGAKEMAKGEATRG